MAAEAARKQCERSPTLTQDQIFTNSPRAPGTQGETEEFSGGRE